MNKSYQTIEDLIKYNLNTDDENKTILLIKEFEPIKKKGYFNKDEFIKMAKWKSPRPLNLYLQNTPEDIEKISKKVISTTSEIEKIVFLTRLNGINIPAASAILMFIDPNNYGVIDIRVWKLLYDYGVFNHNKKGISFDANDWLDYICFLREYAIKFNITVRHVERILFFYHRKHYGEKLYG